MQSSNVGINEKLFIAHLFNLDLNWLNEKAKECLKKHGK